MLSRALPSGSLLEEGEERRGGLALYRECSSHLQAPRIQRNPDSLNLQGRIESICPCV